MHIRLRRVQPAAHDISKRGFTNIKADVLKALALSECSRERSAWQHKPSPEWTALLEMITDKHDLWKLSQLAQYCSAVKISPNDVADEHDTAFTEILKEETVADKPDRIAVYAVKTWNRLRKELPGWPDITLSPPPQPREPWTIPLNTFPTSFQEEVAQRFDRLKNPDPLDQGHILKFISIVYIYISA